MAEALRSLAICFSNALRCFKIRSKSCSAAAYRGANPYQGVMPAGYPGTPGYAYPAGGIPPLTMPGVLPLRR